MTEIARLTETGDPRGPRPLASPNVPVGTLGMLAYRYNDVIADGRAGVLGAALAVAWRVAGGGFGRPSGLFWQGNPAKVCDYCESMILNGIFCNFMQFGFTRPTHYPNHEQAIENAARERANGKAAHTGL